MTKKEEEKMVMDLVYEKEGGGEDGDGLSI